jgi:hypothetical protein
VRNSLRARDLNKDDEIINFYLDGELEGTMSSETGADNAWTRDRLMEIAYVCARDST